MKENFNRYPSWSEDDNPRPIFVFQVQQPMKIEKLIIDADEGVHIVSFLIGLTEMIVCPYEASLINLHSAFPVMKPGIVVGLAFDGIVRSVEAEFRILKPLQDKQYTNGFKKP